MENEHETFFLHTKLRIVERYHDILGQPLEITQDVWESWNKFIPTNSSEAIYLTEAKGVNGGSIWRVWFGIYAIFVVFQNNTVITALFPKKYFKNMAENAFQKRLRSKK